MSIKMHLLQLQMRLSQVLWLHFTDLWASMILVSIQFSERPNMKHNHSVPCTNGCQGREEPEMSFSAFSEAFIPTDFLTLNAGLK